MNTKDVVKSIDLQIANLLRYKANLLKQVNETKLTSMVTFGRWVIDTRTNTHYQFTSFGVNSGGSIVTINRRGKNSDIINEMFNKHYRLATPKEIENHIRFLDARGYNYLNVTFGPETFGPALTEYLNLITDAVMSPARGFNPMK